MERYRIHGDAQVYFITFSVVDWLPVFVAESSMKIVVDSFNYCHQQKWLRTNAVVIMPSHLHAIVFDAEGKSERLNRTLIDFRKFTGRQLTNWCLEHAPRCFSQTLEALAPDDREHRFWQATRHPESLFSEPFYRQKLDYLHANPVRKGLVLRAADWRYSSARAYVADDIKECDIALTAIDWG